MAVILDPLDHIECIESSYSIILDCIGSQNLNLQPSSVISKIPEQQFSGQT